MTTLENNLSLDFAQPGSFDVKTGPIRAKVICTIGPKTVPIVGKLVEAGMNVARLNFSHGSHEYHASVISAVREYLAKSRRMAGIMLDTKGPEIRSGKLVGGKEITVTAGQELVLTTDFAHVGDKTMIGQSYADLPTSVEEGGEILIDDGLIGLVVVRVDGEHVVCRVKNDGVIGETKGVNLPGAKVKLPPITEKDKADLKFGCEQRVDMVAASFIRKASDVEEIRAFLKEHGGSSIKIISKIENQEGLENFDEILAASDAIMVARGDLGVEIPIELVSIAQKMMISKCNIAGKAVITATQMLESMIKNPRPTRAESTDVANAVFDGSDCVMLSGETAKGDFPIEAVSTMVGICREAEAAIDYNNQFQTLRSSLRKRGGLSVTETITSSAVKTAYDLNAALILCLTESGQTAEMVSKYRPKCPVVCVTSNESSARQLLIRRGAFPLVVGSMLGTESIISRCLVRATSAGLCKTGDMIVLVSGMREGVSGSTNILRVMQNDATVPATVSE